MSIVLTATCRRRDDRFGVSARDELDQFLTSLDAPWPGSKFMPVGKDWVEVDRPEASEFVLEVANYSLAYGDRGKAPWLGFASPDEFVGRFSSVARYFTNGWPTNWRALSAYTCGGGSTSTFNAGLGVVDVEDLGILWVQDED